MEFWVTILSLARRKRVIIPALLIAVSFGAFAYLVTPTRYVSSAVMVVTPTPSGGIQSRDPSMPTGLINPLLNFDDSLTTTSAILISAMSTKDVAKKLGAVGPTRVEIDDGRTNPDLLGLNGPFIYVVGRSTSPGEASRVVMQAQAMMRGGLHERQDALGAPQETFVSLVDVVPPSAPEADRGQPVQFGLLAFILGFGLTMAAAYYGHQNRLRQRMRWQAQGHAGSTNGVAEPPEEDIDQTASGRASSPISIVVTDVDENHAAPPAVPNSSPQEARSTAQ